MAIRIRNRVNTRKLAKKLLRNKGDEIARDMDERFNKLESSGLSDRKYTQQGNQNNRRS